MLYNTKLNEFEPEQIDLYLLLIEAKLEDLRWTLSRIATWDDSSMKLNKQQSTNWEWESFTLLKVQLQNAKSDIKDILKPTEN